MPLTSQQNPLVTRNIQCTREGQITNHQTRALNAFPRPRGQNPRSGRWPRFAEIYGGHTTMLLKPKPPCFTIPNADLSTHLPRSGSTTQIVLAHQRTTAPHPKEGRHVLTHILSARSTRPRESRQTNTFGTLGGTCQKLMVETRAQAKLKNKTVEMTSEAPESTSPIIVIETEHAVRTLASGPITTDRTAESMGEQAVVEDLMAK
ncbi:unnamed protein product [Prunus armeniaca]